ncbi:tripartite tricarboxylate transporter substrate binding protein BugD [Pigmentiphaga soli]|uniref:Tripartite tricarboxylate transporter substrate binding protein BugD n=1 Tax=Pigmentiphaga soli TaxID=1007095 RepID=A0ABP8HAK8_9BURK
MRKLLCAFAAALTLAGAAAPAAAKYPDKPITLILPFAVGGPTDLIARLIASGMSDDLGQQVVVKNIGGAGGVIGSGEVAKAAPDGYTLLFHHIGMATAPALYPDLKFDPLKDFSYVGLIAEGPAAIVARKDLPPNTLGELVAYMKKNQPDVTMVNGGVGGASYLCAILFSHFIGTKVTYVPYKGMGPALIDVLGGQADTACDLTTSFAGYLDAGKLKGYALAAPQRMDLVRQLPTTEEAGLPGFHFSVWFGMYAPKHTPDDVIATVNASLKKVLRGPGIAKKMNEMGVVIVPQEQITPRALQERLTKEVALWTPLINEALAGAAK